MIPTLAALLIIFEQPLPAAENAAAAKAPEVLSRPVSLAECLDLAIRWNSTILKGKSDLEAAYGVVVQTRAIVIPKLRASGNYQIMDENSLEQIPFPGAPSPNDQQWLASIRLVQSIYEGGRMTAALRSARLTKDQAILSYQAVVADTLLAVRTTYDDVLLAEKSIEVQQASVNLLSRELEDTTRRYEAGTVPRFNQLRAEVELANAQPKLIRAQNAYRIAKNNLANLLGYNLPKEIWDDIPLQLSGTLEAQPFEMELPAALTQALACRPELGALRKAEKLRREAIKTVQAGYKPSVQVYTGYSARNLNYSPSLAGDVHGWIAGVQMSWDLFDGGLARGRIEEARAQHRKAEEEIADVSRRVELEVRTAYSNFVEAKEVLKSQEKVQEQAEEALRLATARSEAGTSTQLDVLNAQTSLTQARTTRVQALHDYSVARARLERAIGLNLVPIQDLK